MDIISYVMGMQAGKKSAESGGSSGGGTLPAGIYLASPEWSSPSSYRYRVFKFNGETYALAGSVTSAGYANYLYKLDSTTNKWTTLLSTTTGSYGLAEASIDSTAWSAVEYDGKFHFLSGKYHAIFDGTNFTKSTSIPNGISTNLAVYQNKLYAFESDYYYLYEWDGTNSTWTSLGILSGKPYYMYGINGELYFSKSNTLYKYVDGTLETYMTCTYSLDVNNVHILNDALYYTNGGGKKSLYKVNLSTKEETLIAKRSGFLKEFYSVNTNDISFVGITNNTTASYVPFFIMNIVE